MITTLLGVTLTVTGIDCYSDPHMNGRKVIDIDYSHVLRNDMVIR